MIIVLLIFLAQIGVIVVLATGRVSAWAGACDWTEDMCHTFLICKVNVDMCSHVPGVCYSLMTKSRMKWRTSLKTNMAALTTSPLRVCPWATSCWMWVPVHVLRIMLRTHLRCKMSTEANVRCFSSLTGQTCAALVACNTKFTVRSLQLGQKC